MGSQADEHATGNAGKRRFTTTDPERRCSRSEPKQSRCAAYATVTLHAPDGEMVPGGY